MNTCECRGDVMDIDEKVHVFEKSNLDGYCNLFQFINNSRRKTRKDGFMEIHCYQGAQHSENRRINFNECTEKFDSSSYPKFGR